MIQIQIKIRSRITNFQVFAIFAIQNIKNNLFLFQHSKKLEGTRKSKEVVRKL